MSCWLSDKTFLGFENLLANIFMKEAFVSNLLKEPLLAAPVLTAFVIFTYQEKPEPLFIIHAFQVIFLQKANLASI